ncbi:MAG: hypothetical protein WCI01_07135 [Chlorobiaceae bacterium]
MFNPIQYLSETFAPVTILTVLALFLVYREASFWKFRKHVRLLQEENRILMNIIKIIDKEGAVDCPTPYETGLQKFWNRLKRFWDAL